MRDNSRGATRTPVKPMGRPKKSAPDSMGKQKSILGFFSKVAPPGANGSTSSSTIRHTPNPDQTETLKARSILVPTLASSSARTEHGATFPQPLRKDGHEDERHNWDRTALLEACGGGGDDDDEECEIENNNVDYDNRTPSGCLSLVVHGMEDIGVSDDGNTHQKEKKRKRQPEDSNPRKRSTVPSPSEDPDDQESQVMCQWRYDPNNVRPPQPAQPRPAILQPTSAASSTKGKDKAHNIKEPRGRSAWLANVMDMEKRTPDHPEYDKSTLFIPPHIWNNFTPFEKQYWTVKQKYWDTVVFFRKGKFYELLENDAILGHQLFDLRVTERINMPMVGFPVSSFDTWANQFLSKGYKVARVDELESALGMEMRVRDSAAAKKQKIIRRELGCVLTGGTLVEEAMLHDDMATYCAAIKESTIDDKPAFGIAFVDTATGQFYVSQFQDDADLTKFETFVVQTSPRELVLEKSRLSAKALRILKNNATPMTIWNHLKPGTDFWDADTTRLELDSGDYFVSDEGTIWPETLAKARDNDLLLSAFGALVHYLRTLKLERSLLSRGNFQLYNPIHRNGTLVLDGQTLINLEVFANSVNGGSEGTLFKLLNRCITPFGKRLFRQWVCHPLCNAQKINERLDAVDVLNADCDIREQFSAGMTKIADLERLISRIHAGSCKPNDFVRVLEGFEQIEYTTSLLRTSSGGSNGIIGRLLTSMPNLSEPLDYWKGAFDREKAREEGLFIPSRGIEDDFDRGSDNIDRIKRELQTLLTKQKSALRNRSIKFADIGKEVYQLEVPKAVKVPKDWRQISATASVKRYYFRELDGLIRELQEAEEIHLQVIRDITSSFYRRFDVDSETWLRSIHIVAQLDCLISLASLSSSLGEPRCRPRFVDEERSVVEFEELRYLCIPVDDFIPNDIKLGGDEAKINLLTGANAAGKSTILRMTCTAVIMAQIGCYVPAISARLTPIDRIMSRLGANDNIFAAQSTFFIELSETKKILAEATPRSLVILDELGRGTSSYDGLAVAQAVLHHIASHIGCVGFFATHYRSLTAEFDKHPEIRPRRMRVYVDDVHRRVTFLYKLEDGVAESSFGMHCAAMCGIPGEVVEKAEVAAQEWEHTSRLKESLEHAKAGCYIPLGVLSDVSNMLQDDGHGMTEHAVDVLLRAIEAF
ncbi:DNA mismatch repair protein msh6 [Madurella mycetomatis]|uniref:DNA mismatch repair protein n=1 Tax=Madurella mycetomatis TaxID=100816 RepID=A0A175VV93_9PEZI|nr:DNA mismatch repair protein msh6 [Madurella mycetomatis]